MGSKLLQAWMERPKGIGSVFAAIWRDIDVRFSGLQGRIPPTDPNTNRLWCCHDVRSRSHVHQSGAARTHPLAVELGIASHLRDAFLRRYLWCDVRGTWGSSSESATTPDPFS